MASQKREEAIATAKAYMMSRKDGNGLSVYDHMTKMIQQYIAERPKDPMDVFDQMSDRIDREGFVPPKDTLKVEEEIPSVLATAQQEQAQIVDVAAIASETGMDDVAETLEDTVPNILETRAFFENGGVGLSPEETYRVFVALKHLSQTKPFLDKVRFWGKIFGLRKNYIIAEGELKPNTDEDDDEADDSSKTEGEAEGGGDDDENIAAELAEGEEDEDAPVKKKKPLLPVPPEVTGTGCNMKIYYVCNEPGEKWQRLPDVQPDHIVVARKIKKYFTGNLKAEICSYPLFQGSEANYLRAQIARISASTIISPTGYYAMPEEEDEEVEDAPETMEVNPEYEPQSNQELMDSLTNWVHHVKYILPQGRCRWFNQLPDTEEDYDDEEEDDDTASRSSQERPEPMEPESGPPILSPVSEDSSPALGGAPAWTLMKTLRVLPQHAHVVLQSNLWPGAYTAGTGRNFDSIYIGFGHKYSREPFSPAIPPVPSKEIKGDPAITEVADPTVEDEEEAMKKKKAEEEDGEGEEDGDEEEDEEDD